MQTASRSLRVLDATIVEPVKRLPVFEFRCAQDWVTTSLGTPVLCSC